MKKDISILNLSEILGWIYIFFKLDFSSFYTDWDGGKLSLNSYSPTFTSIIGDEVLDDVLDEVLDEGTVVELVLDAVLDEGTVVGLVLDALLGEGTVVGLVLDAMLDEGIVVELVAVWLMT